MTSCKQNSNFGPYQILSSIYLDFRIANFLSLLHISFRQGFRKNEYFQIQYFASDAPHSLNFCAFTLLHKGVCIEGIVVM